LIYIHKSRATFYKSKQNHELVFNNVPIFSFHQPAAHCTISSASNISLPIWQKVPGNAAKQQHKT